MQEYSIQLLAEARKHYIRALWSYYTIDAVNELQWTFIEYFRDQAAWATNKWKLRRWLTQSSGSAAQGFSMTLPNLFIACLHQPSLLTTKSWCALHRTIILGSLPIRKHPSLYFPRHLKLSRRVEKVNLTNLGKKPFLHWKQKAFLPIAGFRRILLSMQFCCIPFDCLMFWRQKKRDGRQMVERS